MKNKEDSKPNKSNWDVANVTDMKSIDANHHSPFQIRSPSEAR